MIWSPVQASNRGKPLIYNEKFEAVVSRLDKVKRSGDSVRAVCPVHGSKGQTLSVTAKDGGYIVANCFSCGAGGPELVKALGLPVGLLFPDDGYIPPVITKEMRRKNIEDGLMSQMMTEPKTLEESRALNLSRERLKGYELKAEQVDDEAPPICHPALDPFRQNFAPALRSSPALRSELVESHWESVVDRVRRSEAEMMDRQPETTAEPAPKLTAEAWLLAQK